MGQNGRTKQGKRPLLVTNNRVVNNEEYPVHFAGRLHVQF